MLLYSFVQIDSRVRPFLSSPLRLAATGRECPAFDQQCDFYHQLCLDFVNKQPDTTSWFDCDNNYKSVFNGIRFAEETALCSSWSVQFASSWDNAYQQLSCVLNINAQKEPHCDGGCSAGVQ